MDCEIVGYFTKVEVELEVFVKIGNLSEIMTIPDQIGPGIPD